MCDGTLTFRLLVAKKVNEANAIVTASCVHREHFIRSNHNYRLRCYLSGPLWRPLWGVSSPSALAQYCHRYAQNTIGEPDDGSGVNSDSYEIFMRRWHPHDSSNNGNHERRSWWKRVEVRRRRKSPIFLAFLEVVKTGRKEIIRD